MSFSPVVDHGLRGGASHGSRECTVKPVPYAELVEILKVRKKSPSVDLHLSNGRLNGSGDRLLNARVDKPTNG